MKAEKVYLVQFNKYTNYCRDVVSNGKDNINEVMYFEIPTGGLLVRESQLADFAEFGDGYESIKLVGSMYFEEEGE